MQMSNTESNHNLKGYYVHIFPLEDTFMKDIFLDLMWVLQ